MSQGTAGLPWYEVKENAVLKGVLVLANRRKKET